MVILSIPCLVVLIICSSLPVQAAHVPEVNTPGPNPVSDVASEVNTPAPSQLNVDDLYGQNCVRIVRRTPEPMAYVPWMCSNN